ncbi:sugar ABC transporter ATP-binding protein [Microbacterium terricola]|uniref:ABC transporter ATP-binding protein n=1 Tax=Microbacterium terricola TaxID=344163 RepID=A0ABM8DWL8_9MICO|nr:sugar ABC transporter ATP-binding protein [Microbacterium terricola]UYK39376.1 sugar ABC transporter ATP-binding protein [Microbacterium terricola]BDV29900.1 ABC transporter ATP-binding protein [Microbacterium terricola]
MTTASSVPVLAVRELRKRFAETRALDGVSFDVRAHEVVGLIGENGAGKSTLLKTLIGLVQPDSGSIEMRGEPVRMRGIAQAGAAGIGMVFQEQSLIPNLTVAENILLAAEGPAVVGGLYRWRELNRRAQVQLDKIGSKIRPETITEELSFADRQMVEIAKVLATEERTNAEPVVLLDEPTSVLDRDETEVLFAQIERLRARASVVFVSHRLDEVLRVSDRVFVLRNGQTVAECIPGEVDEETLRRLMIGRDLEGSHYSEELQAPAREEVLLSVRDLSVRGVCEQVGFDVHAGEVLGIAGVQGSGREELCRSLFGALATRTGRVTINGARARLRSPRAAIAAEVGFVPAERRKEGMVASMSVAENITLPHIEKVCAGPVLLRGRERAIADEWIERLSIRTPGSSAPLGSLSGGNQQKAVLARWMVSDSLRLLILDHPTRGLDVGAKGEVYRLIRELTAAGVAVVLMADSLEELIAMSHRVLVMRDGRVVDVLDAPLGAKPAPVEVLERMI